MSVTEHISEQAAADQDAIIRAQRQELLEACRRNLRHVDEAMIGKAFDFCVQAHGKDLRASGEAYYTHPIQVAKIVATELPLDDVSVAAALLHDVVEDTEFSQNDIRQEFGEEVANIVDGATKITDVFKSHEITKAASYRKLLISLINDVRVILVKFADRLHNMRTLQYLKPEKQKRLARETLTIYAPLAHRFGLGSIKWELEDLAFKYTNRPAYDEIKNSLNIKRQEREDYIRNFSEPIEEQLREAGFKFEVGGRAKHIFSIYNKLVNRGKTIEEIYDLFAVRIILDTPKPNDCFTVYGIVSDIYTPVPERFKNYISVPKKNGYQSLHTTVIGPQGRKVEVQIRTRTMHEVAEKGVAAHFRYKEISGNSYIEDAELEEWVHWVRDVFDSAGEDAPEQVVESFKLNLYQNEIYLFTPKGELRILPQKATPVDFAYAIHTKVGHHCIGAKVNQKIVPLDYELHSGDQVEIITSKNQRPNKDWEKFAITHKAKSNIRKFFKEERRVQISDARELWARRMRKLKVHINDDELEKIVRQMRYMNKAEFFFALGAGKITLDAAEAAVLERWNKAGGARRPESQPEETAQQDAITFDKFKHTARTEADGVYMVGSDAPLKYSYARCCNPVPGDDITGVVTVGGGVKIHRTACKNIVSMQESLKPRLVDVRWSSRQAKSFMAAIKVTGDDRPAMLNDLTSAILSCDHTNIRSVNIDSYDSLFEGVITVHVMDVNQVEEIFRVLRTVKGVKTVSRFEG